MTDGLSFRGKRDKELVEAKEDRREGKPGVFELREKGGVAAGCGRRKNSIVSRGIESVPWTGTRRK